MRTEYNDVMRTGAELVHAHNGQWFLPTDIRSPVVVFIHGFTSHGRYLARLADFIGAHGFSTVLFNYDSFRGIDQAALDLQVLLSDIGDGIRREGLFLIGHSMGGLVARYFAQYNSERSNIHVRGIATLGTPHGGTLSKKHLGHFLDWADSITVPNPFCRSPACPSAMQLTDASSAGLIGRLNQDATTDERRIPVLSISGGLPFLEFESGSNGGFAGMLRNLVLQRLIGERPNDGLVPESSANVSTAIGFGPHRSHIHEYPGYERVNHSYLGKNQQVAGIIVRWLRDLSQMPIAESLQCV